eukprot:4826107-Prymnesium_polylepis.1
MEIVLFCSLSIVKSGRLCVSLSPLVPRASSTACHNQCTMAGVVCEMAEMRKNPIPETHLGSWERLLVSRLRSALGLALGSREVAQRTEVADRTGVRRCTRYDWVRAPPDR